MRPIRLDANQLHHFYRGGERIARFRGIASADPYAPEDWVGSTTTIFGEDERGLTLLADGRTLRDAIAADPDGFLGAAHVRRYGPDPALLVKLLDAGERLPVHCHPDRDFARRHLGRSTGKTEAWLIVEADGASVHLGFRDDVDAAVVAEWVELQDREAMLEQLNELRVVPGDRIYVPAGLPHAIGEGILLVELQEPSDLSVLLEWTGFGIDGRRGGHLGLGFEVALGCLTRSALDDGALAHLRRASADLPEARPGVTTLLPPEADAFFRAERLRPHLSASLEPGFSILVAVAGQGLLETDRGGEVGLTRGDTVLVPHAAGRAELTGEIDVLRCLPPTAEA